MDKAILQKKLERSEAKIAILDKMIEDITRELYIENEAKEKQNQELKLAIQELSNAQQYQIQIIEGLKSMMHITSHKVRTPIVQILGLINVLEDSIHSPSEIENIITYMRESALLLDDLTKDLTKFITEMENKQDS